MQKKHAAILAGVLVLAGGGVVVGLLVKKAKSKKTATPASSATSATTPSNTSPSSTGTSNTAVTSTPLLPPMTDDQANTWAANVTVLYKATSLVDAQKAAAALYPIMNLGMSPDQIKRLGTTAPTDTDRKVIKARYVG